MTSPIPAQTHPPGGADRKLALRHILDSIKSQYDMIYVARMAGVRLQRRGNTYLVANCPFHQESSPSFKIKQNNPHHFKCFGCNRSGDIFNFIELFYHLPTLNEQVQFLTGRTLDEHSRGVTTEQAAAIIEQVKTRRAEFVSRREKEEAEYAPVPDEEASPVYESMLDVLDLSGADCDRMRERGLDPAQCYTFGYRTLPVPRSARISLCEGLITEGNSLLRVPGFFRLPSKAAYLAGRWCVAGTVMGWREVRDRQHGISIPVEGLLIPTCNEDGRVVRLKLRNSPPPASLPARLIKAWPEKYIILSSDHSDGGANAGVRLHHAGPRDGGRWPNTLWATEGEIKADVSSWLLEARFTGLPGVTQWPELVIQAALAGHYTKLYIAMDQETKDDKRQTVAYATEKLCRMALEAGIDPFVVIWNADAGKGFDDLLVTAGSWALQTHGDWWNHLHPVEREYSLKRLAIDATNTPHGLVA